MSIKPAPVLKSTFFIVFFLIAQIPYATAQNSPGKKVKLLVIVNSKKTPLYVHYTGSGKMPLGDILLEEFFPWLPGDPGERASSSNSRSRKFERHVGDFARYPVIEQEVLANFEAVSKYFDIDVINDRRAMLREHTFDLDEPYWQGYHFLLFLDETYPGLCYSHDQARLSASTIIRYELYNTASKKTLDMDSYLGADTTKREYDSAIADGGAFRREYPNAVALVIHAIYNQLYQRNFLDQMAETQGLDYVVPDPQYKR